MYLKSCLCLWKRRKINCDVFFLWVTHLTFVGNFSWRQTSVKRSVLIGTGVFVVDTQDEQTSTIDQPSREVQRQQLRERLRADLLSRHNQESLPTQSRDGNGDGSHEDHDQASEDSVENRGLVSTDIDSRMNSNTDLSDFCEDEWTIFFVHLHRISRTFFDIQFLNMNEWEEDVYLLNKQGSLLTYFLLLVLLFLLHFIHPLTENHLVQ